MTTKVAELADYLHKVSKAPTNEETDLMFGEVLATNPIKIRVDNRFDIDSDFIILSKMVKPLSVDIRTSTDGGWTHTHKINGKGHEESQITAEGVTGGAHSHTATVSVWGGLKVGDKVIMLRVQQGQLFYVLERV